MLRWLPAHEFEYDYSLALTAAARSKATTLDFLLENGCPGMDADFVACCVQDGSLEALEGCYDTLRMRVPEIWTGENLQDWLLLAGHCGRRGASLSMALYGLT